MLRIFIGDLTHNYRTVSNETMPLGAAFVRAYLGKVFQSDVDCALFRYPDVLLRALERQSPDVLMLSNYLWNEALSLWMFERAKQASPGTLTVMGGPNIFLDATKQRQFLEQHPYLDFFIVGEAERPAAEIVAGYLRCDRDIQKLKKTDIPACLYLLEGGGFHDADGANLLRDLNDIPSPWLNGLMDEFFDGKLAPLIETTRGCPFQCLYCVQGASLCKKVRHFSLDRLGKEINYIAQMIRAKSPGVGFLCIADPNFGMYDHDVKVAAAIHQVQQQYGWPTFIDATTGKNRRDSILETMGYLKGALVMYNSVQSLNPTVLRNIRRTNIDPVLMREIQEQAAAMGITTLTETILSLPGETLQSHKAGLHHLIRMGIRQFTNYQCMMLKGAVLETDACRRKYNLQTHCRVLPRNFGVYGGRKIVEVEEIITCTSTLSFEEYCEARKLHLLLIVYFNGYRFEPLIRLLEQRGVTVNAWLEAMLDRLPEAPAELQQLFRDFDRETRGELFPTRESCQSFYKEDDHFEALSRGDIGGNLLMKYYSMAAFDQWPAVVNHAMDAAEQLLVQAPGDEFTALFVKELRPFLIHRMAHGQTLEQILGEGLVAMRCNVGQWIRDGYPELSGRYEYEVPRPVRFALSEQRSGIVRNAFAVYGGDVIGKSKLVTRIQYADLVRDCHEIGPVAEGDA